MTTMFTAADLVAAERRKQLAKGFTPEHDDEHVAAQLARAGASYTITAIWQMFGVEGDEIIIAGQPAPELEWPWDYYDYRPDEAPINNLVKAAALIEAEIDRQIRRVP